MGRLILIGTLSFILALGSPLATVSTTAKGVDLDETTSPCAVGDNEDAGEEQQSDDVDLAGRLGGTREDAEAIYGEPINDEFFLEYEIESCGTVFISYFEDQETIDITVFSPREGEDQDFNEPNDADWTVREAETIVRHLLPSDAEEVGTLVEDDGLIMVEGFSSTLEREVSEAAYDYGDNSPTYGGYSYVLNLTTVGEVSTIIVQLNIEDRF